MKLPVSWLKEYVDFDDTPEGLAEKLTFAGVEVEGIQTVGSDYTGLVVGEVRHVEPHPNADRLSVCRVFDGREEVAVVCGAPNVRAGSKGALAPAGTTLPDGTRLKKTKIRGVESFGMLCAEDELGLSDEHTGILVVEGDWAAGTPLAEVLGPPETVLDLEITPNRPDCLSVIGIAREVAALYGASLRVPEVILTESGPAAGELTRVDVEDVLGCPRYTARILREVRVQPSPPWMQKRLTLAGIRPINNLVDITNYVLLECGHPLHAFDQALLEEGRVVVRRARPGEKITTLDDVERPLDESVLVIADAKKPVAVAGVMGGAGSEIQDGTQTVLLESAYFDPPLIRATSMKLGLRTESSYRFERGTDVMGVDWASRRVAALMADLAGGQVARGVVDVFPVPPAPRTVRCRWDKTRALLGVDVETSAIEASFAALGLEVRSSDGAGCTVGIPSFRGDLEREVDLIEEFARVYGLEQIPERPPKAQLVPGAEDTRTQAVHACRASLAALGLAEVINYTLVSSSLLDLFDRADAPERVRLPHPISQDQAVLRTSLVPQVIETLGRNHARQSAQMACYEVGRVFRRQERGTPAETERLAIGLTGPVGRTGLDRRRPVESGEMFLWIRGIWEQLAHAQGLTDVSAEATNRAYLRDGWAVSLVCRGQPRGCLGLVRPDLAATWRLSGPVAVLEVDFGVLLEGFLAAKRLKPLAPYPSIVRDAAIVVPQSTTHEDVLKIIHKVAPEDLENVELFDIFTGKGVGEGKKSLAYSFTYRSFSRTLTDEDANRDHDAVKSALRKELHAEIRES